MSLRLAIGKALARGLMKPAMRRQSTAGQARVAMEWGARVFLRDPPGTRAKPWGDGGLRLACGRRAARSVILYLHGGGYIAGSPATHRAMLARLSARTGLPAVLPAYPLAPEHPAPAAFEAARAAFDRLLDEGHAPGGIVLGGDSAGGGLALALLSDLCRAGLPPRAAFALSPWTDMTLSGASLAGNARADPLLPVERIEELRGMVLGGLGPDDPRVSPLFAAFPGCPPVFLQAAATEILRDDTLRMADRLRDEGGQVAVDLWPDGIHAWPLAGRWLPEAGQALDRIADFLRPLMPPPARRGES